MEDKRDNDHKRYNMSHPVAAQVNNSLTDKFYDLLIDHRNLMTVRSSFVMHSANSLDGSSFGLCLIDNTARDGRLFDNVVVGCRSNLLQRMTMLSAYDSLPPVSIQCAWETKTERE